MTLLFCESFDHYTGSSTLSLKWTAGGPTDLPNNLYGRFGRGVVFTGSGSILRKSVGTHGTLIAGAAFKRINSANATSIIKFQDSGDANQVTVLLNADGSVSIQVGAVTVATSVNGGSTPALAINVWHYVELKAIIANVSGYVEVRIDGVVYVTYTGDTQATANNNVQSLVFNNSSNAGSIYYDDIYICSATGTVNNSFLGDVRIECVFANTTGTYSQWSTTGSALNYANINEQSPNDDANYNYSSTPGQVDTFNFQDLSITSGQLFGVQKFIYARKDDAGSRFIAPIHRRNSVNSTGTVHSLGNSYAYYYSIEETDPSISSPWTISNFNDSEWGYIETA